MVRNDCSATTASFDLHKRILTLPVWKNMSSSLTDMLIGHEVGHALYTPGMNPQQFMDYLNDVGPDMDFAKLVWNVVEDARIERLIKKEYPGLRRDFFYGYKQIHEMDMFEIEGKNINELPFIDRLNLYFKIGSIVHDDILFSDQEMIFVNRCETISTHDEVKILSKDIYEFIDFKSNQKKNDSELVEEVNFGSGGDETTESDDASYEQTIGSDFDDEMQETHGKSNFTGNGEGDEPSHEPLKTADTMKNLEKNLQKNTSFTGGTQICTLPEAYPENAIIDYKTFYERVNSDAISRACNQNIERTAAVNDALNNLVAKVKADSERSVNIMVNQFNRKKAADESRKSRINKTGKLNMDKLHQYKISEDIFLSRTVTKDGKNHGFLVFLDWSGSMSYTIHDVMMQLFQIAIFCRKTNIPFEVYSFTNTFFHEKNSNVFDCSEPNSLILQNFSMLNLLSSRMSNTEFDHAMKIMSWFGVRHNYNKAKKLGIWGILPEPPDELGMATTPLYETMVVAAKIIPAFRQKYNLQIVNTIFMTDGDSDCVGYRGVQIRDGEKFSLFDKQTGLSYEYGWGNHEFTNVMAKVIKDRTDCNLIHFHLDSARRIDQIPYHYFTGQESPEVKKTFGNMYNTENFFPAPNKKSFDEVFVLKSTVEIDVLMDESKFLDSKKKTFSSLKNAFIKMNDSKNTSRVMLNRFIDMIAS